MAYLHYRGRDGVVRTLNAGFTRYSVIWTGERLPDGTPADAVYLVLSEPYWEVLIMRQCARSTIRTSKISPQWRSALRTGELQNVRGAEVSPSARDLAV